jgi:hypothetical protein
MAALLDPEQRLLQPVGVHSPPDLGQPPHRQGALFGSAFQETAFWIEGDAGGAVIINSQEVQRGLDVLHISRFDLWAYHTDPFHQQGVFTMIQGLL